MPAKPPQLLNRIETALSNPTLTPATLMIYLSTILYEWINKVLQYSHNNNAIILIDPGGPHFILVIHDYTVGAFVLIPLKFYSVLIIC